MATRKENKRSNVRKKREKVIARLYSQVSFEPPRVKPETDTYKKAYSKLLDWVRLNVKLKELKKEFLLLCKEQKIDNTAFKCIEEDWKFMAVGRHAWLLRKGWHVNKGHTDYYEKKFLELKKEADNILKFKKEENNSNILELKKEEINKNIIITEIDEAFVDKSVFVYFKKAFLNKNPNFVYNLLNERKLKKDYVLDVYNYFKNSLDELNLIGKDDQVTEGYSSYTKADINRQKEWLKDILNQCDNYSQNFKAKRKIRKKRTKKLSVQIKHLNFKKSDSQYNLESIDPMKIIGSNALIVFNTKTRKLGIFISEENKKLEIKGTTIQNFNKENSISFQKIIRKPKSVLPNVRKGTLRRCKIIIEREIKAKPSILTGRINKDMILLKVFK